MNKKEQPSVFPGAKKFLKKELEMIQQGDEYDKFLEERATVATKYKIMDETKLEKRADGWYFGGIKVEDLDDFDDMSSLPHHRGQD